MKNKYMFFFILVLALIFFTVPQGMTQPKAMVKAPVITNAYLIRQGRFGDVLKIYIEADDPDSEMLRAATVADQVGYGGYPTDWIYLKPQHQHLFTGYLQWNTYSSHTGFIREWTWVMLSVWVQDKAGNWSNAVIFPFQFVSEVIKNPPLPAPFSQGNLPRLGYVDINLYDPFAG